jgi:hypothetical protein
MAVTVLGAVSQIWDIRCTVSHMVAPYIADEVKQAFVATVPVALDVFDHGPRAAAAPRPEVLCTPPSSEWAEELEGAAQWLGVQPEEILLAALGRALGRTRGDGAVDVDVTGGHRWLHHPVALLCAAGQPLGPTEMLQGAHSALAGSLGHPAARAEILLNLDPVEAAVSDHALELRVRRLDGALHLEWHYDGTRWDAYSVEEIAEQFPLALVEITSDAAAPL